MGPRKARTTGMLSDPQCNFRSTPIKAKPAKRRKPAPCPLCVTDCGVCLLRFAPDTAVVIVNGAPLEVRRAQ